MSEWKKVRLGDVVSILGDGLHGTPKYDANGEYYFINGNNLHNGQIKLKSDTKRVSYDEYLKYRKNLNNRTILVSINGTIGNIAVYNNEKCILGKSACYFNVNEEISKQFIRYIVASNIFQTYLIQYANGTTIKNVSLKAMREFEFDLPPLAEQKRIAGILGSLDDKIELNNKINANLEEQAQALFKRWFVDFEFPDQNGNPYKSSGGELIDSELGQIPIGWTVGTFRNIIISTIGGDWGKESAEGNYSQKVYCIRGADIADVSKGNKGKMPFRYILLKNHSSKKLEPNDLVIEISGGSPTQSTGRIAIISNSLLQRYDHDMICTNFCRAIKPKSKYANFIYSLWRYMYDQKIMFSYENGTTGIKNLNINGLIDSEKITIPPIELLSCYNNLFAGISSNIFTNALENETLSTIRNTLLPKLMNNQIKL